MSKVILIIKSAQFSIEIGTNDTQTVSKKDLIFNKSKTGSIPLVSF